MSSSMDITLTVNHVEYSLGVRTAHIVERLFTP